MIQPNIPFEKKMKKGFETENMDLLVSMTSEAIREDPDIIIWPETSYPNLILHRVDQDPEPVLPEVSQLARSSQTPILVGANYARIRSREDFDVYNAAFLVDSRGDIQDYYAKIYLVPFTEALPFREVFGIQKGRKSGLLALLANFSAGNKFSVFEIESKPRPLNDETGVMGGEVKVTGKRKERFGVLVCYEGLYSELSRQLRKEKADFLVCITNDAWFGRTIAPYWHASALRLRAIENRISIARCANTGVSCFFDPAGRMYQSSEIFTKGVITGSILAAPPFPPLYTRRGNVIVYFAYAALLFMIILAAFLRKKTFKKK
jgi:apolipoprotein N-acyltransferase